MIALPKCKLPSIDVFHKPGDGEVRQAWDILSMKADAIALSPQRSKKRPRRKKARNMILTSNYNLGARGALEGKDSKYLLHMTYFPIMCHGRHS